jgi:hypothetical protein
MDNNNLFYKQEKTECIIKVSQDRYFKLQIKKKSKLMTCKMKNLSKKAAEGIKMKGLKINI